MGVRAKTRGKGAGYEKQMDKKAVGISGGSDGGGFMRMRKQRAGGSDGGSGFFTGRGIGTDGRKR